MRPVGRTLATPVIYGGWTEWSDWRNCTLSCGGGNQTRTRACTNPPPEHNREDCGADDSKTQVCNDFPLPYW
jgi:hypothetical protein